MKVCLLSGDYAFLVGVNDSENAYADREYAISVAKPHLKIATARLAGGIVGRDYRFALAATGGVGMLR